MFTCDITPHVRNSDKKTTIVFVVRDHVRMMTPLERLQEQISADVAQIWKEVNKPTQYENSTVDDFFNLEFESLAHKVLEAEQFSKDVDALRERFCRFAVHFLLLAVGSFPFFG